MKTSERFTCYYRGTSMYPLFRNGDLLLVEPLCGVCPENGDIAVFSCDSSSVDDAIVHRVVDISSDGILTKGDNNGDIDPWVLPLSSITGRVTGFYRDRRFYAVRGGFRGRFRHVAVQVCRGMVFGGKSVFRGGYHLLGRTPVFGSLLRGSLQPKVLRFAGQGGDELHLMVGGLLAGRCFAGSDRWHIRPPFRLFVDVGSLPVSAPH